LLERLPPQAKTIPSEPAPFHGAEDFIRRPGNELHLRSTKETPPPRKAFRWMLSTRSEGVIGEEPALLNEDLIYPHHAPAREHAHPFPKDLSL